MIMIMIIMSLTAGVENNYNYWVVMFRKCFYNSLNSYSG